VAKPESFLLWGEDDNAIDFAPKKKAAPKIAPPKMSLPGAVRVPRYCDVPASSLSAVAVAGGCELSC
jgi:hypothetical protein